jgi:hypothetical protein
MLSTAGLRSLVESYHADIFSVYDELFYRGTTVLLAFGSSILHHLPTPEPNAQYCCHQMSVYLSEIPPTPVQM